jgi:hypothetical protein
MIPLELEKAVSGQLSAISQKIRWFESLAGGKVGSSVSKLTAES